MASAAKNTEWHKILITSDGLVGLAERFLRKGSKVYLEGCLQTRKWQDQSGADRYTTEIVVPPFGGVMTFLGKAEGGGSGGGQGGGGCDQGGGQGGRSGQTSHGRGGADMDDDIPF